MSYDMFWYGNVWLAKYYFQAHEYTIEQRNQELWLQGLYNYKAYKAVMAEFAFGLNGSKGKKPEGYIEKPLAITKRQRELEKQENIKRTLAWVEQGQKD